MIHTYRYGAEREAAYSTTTKIISRDEKHVFGRIKHDYRRQKYIAYTANGDKLGEKDSPNEAASLVAWWGHENILPKEGKK